MKECTVALRNRPYSDETAPIMNDQAVRLRECAQTITWRRTTVVSLGVCGMKGGVGTTTIAAALAVEFVRLGFRTLLVDLTGSGDVATIFRSSGVRSSECHSDALIRPDPPSGSLFRPSGVGPPEGAGTFAKSPPTRSPGIPEAVPENVRSGPSPEIFPVLLPEKSPGTATRWLSNEIPGTISESSSGRTPETTAGNQSDAFPELMESHADIAGFSGRFDDPERYQRIVFDLGRYRGQGESLHRMVWSLHRLIPVTTAHPGSLVTCEEYVTRMIREGLGDRIDVLFNEVDPKRQ
ncbi:MAG: cellulose synthase operon protein YhjQ/BcsQ, partial [Planctomycetia bacterium]|nr:cellulose synthase operon protein YhjQ/BcsQ [Planctomycetia bacterium]